MKPVIIFIGLFFSFHQKTFSQSCLDKMVSINLEQVSLATVLTELEKTSGCTFSYGSGNIAGNKIVSISKTDISIKDALQSVLGEKLKFKDIHGNIVIYSLNAALQKFKVYGYVKDSVSGEVLGAAHILIPLDKIVIASNDYGFYSLTLPEGLHEISCSFLGYKTMTKLLEVKEGLEIDFLLIKDIQTLEEIEITAEEENPTFANTRMGMQVLKPGTIRSSSVLAGEPDILKTIQLLPGVKTLGEGSSGYFVRGGNMDQNLILIDEAPVYNPSHLLGFFSTFNTDAIKNVKFYSSAIPAVYGGRLSSLADVRIKDGNDKDWITTGGIGLISGRLTIEGPVVKEKSSIMVSGRRTYGDLLLPLVANPDITDTNLNFYDLHVKLNYKFSPKDRIFFSTFNGRDLFRKKSEFKINWGNQTSTFRWNHIFSEKLFSNFSFLYSKYFYRLGIENDNNSMSHWTSSVKDLTFKADFSIFLNNTQTLRIGVNSIYHEFQPADYSSEGENEKTDINMPTSNALEHGLYVSHEHQASEKLLLEYGFRYSLFQNIGKSKTYVYNDDYKVIDSAYHMRGEIFNYYDGLEPRVSVQYKLGVHKSLKISYTRMFQYLQQISNYTTSFSAPDIWISASPNIKPQIADQIALGFYNLKNCRGQIIQFSIEGYYKTFTNQLDYKDHAELALNPHVEAELRNGKAWSYGVESVIAKSTGRLTGSVNYTWSRALRKIEGINQEKRYPARYDRPLSLNVLASCYASERWTAGANWIFTSGEAVTLPVGAYAYKDKQVPIYSDRNSKRYPSYHRLDLSATLRPKPGKKKYESTWTFALYNAYYRKNTFALNYNRTVDNFGNVVSDPLGMDPSLFGMRKSTTKTYLFSIVPSISYNFKF